MYNSCNAMIELESDGLVSTIAVRKVAGHGTAVVHRIVVGNIVAGKAGFAVEDMRDCTAVGTRSHHPPKILLEAEVEVCHTRSVFDTAKAAVAPRTERANWRRSAADPSQDMEIVKRSDRVDTAAVPP